MALMFLQRDLTDAIESEPVPNLVIPLWLLIAYITVISRKPIQQQQLDFDHAAAVEWIQI